MRWHHWLAAAVCCAALAAGVGTAPGQRAPAGQPPAADQPSRQELDGARHRLENFEKKVARSGGQPIKLDMDGREAMERIRALKERYPDHPGVEELFQRARNALLASKGDIVQITPDMLVYRENEQKLKRLFAEIADREWAELKQQAEQTPDAILKPFPPISHDDVTIAQMRGRLVVLEGLSYPANQFKDMGREFVHIGSPSRGYYYVELSNRSWAGAYAAFKRYRRLVNRDIPEQATWTLLGRIRGLDLLIPQAGEDPIAPARWGWTVEPVAIYLAGATLAVADPDSEVGGRFAGEPEMERIKSAMYTVTSIPDDATPERVVEVFSIAIKEKNYPLYLDCIDPNRRRTPIALDLCQYHWDWHQHRFATFYVLVKIEPARVGVLEGFDEGSSIETFFLTDEEREKLRQASGRLVEQAEVRTRAYDERGRQYGSPKTFFLRRVDKGRWHIVNYPQPF